MFWHTFFQLFWVLIVPWWIRHTSYCISNDQREKHAHYFSGESCFNRVWIFINFFWHTHTHSLVCLCSWNFSEGPNHLFCLCLKFCVRGSQARYLFTSALKLFYERFYGNCISTSFFSPNGMLVQVGRHKAGT